MTTNLSMCGACVLVALAAGCGDNLSATTDGRTRDSTLSDDGSATGDAHGDAASDVAPVVISSIPTTAATGIPRDETVSATFSEPMDRATLTTATFELVAEVGAVAVPGTVIATDTTIAFAPTALLAASTSYIATITTGVESTSEVPLAASHSWTFTTGATTTPLGIPVDLGTAGNFVLLGKSGITNVPLSKITGDIGVSPITSTAITGFPLTRDASNEFATTPQVVGRVYAADFAAPTPANLTAAVSDMQVAFAAAAARPPDVTELGAGTVGSVTLAPGVYAWSSALTIPTDITLSGRSTDVWIFQVAQDLTLSSGVSIFMAGGAIPSNVFWEVRGQLVVNTGAHLEGNVLTLTAATLGTGASLNGRLLAQTLVTIRGSEITEPAH